MPLQNRVDPFGTLFRTPARGTFMGNRGGALHNGNREIVRPYLSRRWITCVLEFKGRHRTVMAPNRYTELFFLDEAVAFAAGHRPCAECRREKFNEFKAAWRRWKGMAPEAPLSADEMDLELHPARTERGRKVIYEARLDSLPDGCFVEMEQTPWLVRGDGLFLWTPEGYRQKRARPRRLAVKVLTPRPMVECFRRGYEPEIHGSWRECEVSADAP
ncbi:MAG TPA: hypothetical protein VKT49_20310 [Bryobacteraceae bacterium]|nr:hypothetical protein [Bryobacteraceae bacterium]